MPTLNRRILHKLGARGSVVVAVPQDWLRYYGLKRETLTADESLKIQQGEDFRW